MNRLDVTYEFCGISDVEAFYAEKQQGHLSPDADLLRAEPVYSANILLCKDLWIGRLIAAIAALRGRRLKVLEYGCGFGSMSFLADVASCDLYGVDYNAAAAPALADAGYKGFVAGDFLTADLSEFAPFDVICSLDVYGHIEFRNKDAVIERWHSLLAPGGAIVEGVETGHFDYFASAEKCQEFAAIDGHIGLEPWPEILDRYRSAFDHVAGQHHFAVTFNYEELVKQWYDYRLPQYERWGTFAATLSPDEGQVFDVVQGLLFWELAQTPSRALEAHGTFGFLVASDDPEVAALTPAPIPGTAPLDLAQWARDLPPELVAIASLSAAASADFAAKAVGDMDVPQLERLPVPVASPAKRRVALEMRRIDPRFPLGRARAVPRWMWSHVPEPIRASAPVAWARNLLRRVRPTQ